MTMDLMKAYVDYYASILKSENAITDMKCPICDTPLIQKEDWIFCPQKTKETPDCDILYHIAKNKKTGVGWVTEEVK